MHRIALLLALVLGGCVCDTPDLRDGGNSPDPTDGGDVNDDGGVADAGDAGRADAGIVPVEDRALAICEPIRRGLVQSATILTLAGPRCRAAESNGDALGGPLDVENGACTASDPVFRALVDAFENERADVDMIAAAACLEDARALRLANGTIGDVPALNAALANLVRQPPCRDVLIPLQEEREECEQSYECLDGRLCEADPLDGPTRICLDPAPEGTRCALAQGTDATLRSCAPTTACILGFCTRRLAVGLSCEPGGIPCNEGRVCDETGTCAIAGVVGTPCSRQDQCSPDLFCVEGECAEDPRIPSGEVCADTDGCRDLCHTCRPDGAGETRCLDRGIDTDACVVNDDCGAAFFCDVDVCTPLHALGESCVRGSCAAPNTCRDALVVVVDAGPEPQRECAAPAAQGEACGITPCASGLFCVESICRDGEAESPCQNDNNCVSEHFCIESACAPAPRANAPCTADGRCGANLTCVDDRCRAEPVAGEACRNDACAAGAFCDDENVCNAAQDVGAPCTENAMCISNNCLDGGTCSQQAASCLGAPDVMLELFTIGAGLVFFRRRFRERISS